VLPRWLGRSVARKERLWDFTAAVLGALAFAAPAAAVESPPTGTPPSVFATQDPGCLGPLRSLIARGEFAGVGPFGQHFTGAVNPGAHQGKVGEEEFPGKRARDHRSRRLLRSVQVIGNGGARRPDEGGRRSRSRRVALGQEYDGSSAHPRAVGEVSSRGSTTGPASSRRREQAAAFASLHAGLPFRLAPPLPPARAAGRAACTPPRLPLAAPRGPAPGRTGRAEQGLFSCPLTLRAGTPSLL
jgi:hypothetical protein